MTDAAEQDTFEETSHALAHDHFRQLSDAVFSQYTKLFLSHAHRGSDGILRVIDVGAGTGCFTIPIATQAQFQPCQLLAIEKARAMADILSARIDQEHLTNVIVVRDDALHRFHVDTANLVICSETIHLFPDLHAALDRLATMLEPTGVLAIRTSSHQQLFARRWYRYFHGALTADLTRHWPIELIRSILEDNGFSTSSYEIDENHLEGKAAYLEKFRKRSYSTLHLIPDEAFELGLQTMQEDVTDLNEVQVDYSSTLVLASLRGN